MVKIREKRVVRKEFKGTSALARRLGVDRSHVSHVLHGRRRSKRVEAEARKLGWKPEEE